MATESSTNACHSPKLVIATRLHLGKATAPPSDSKLKETLDNFGRMTGNIDDAVPVIAVDSTPKIDGYDYVDAIRTALPENSPIIVLPVTPWGKFVPALNALVSQAKTLEIPLIMFVSAEVNVSLNTIETLCSHVTEDPDAIVAGAALPGHEYSGIEGSNEVQLNGRSIPWNTLAVWSVEKLSITGFQLCSDFGSSGGIEECVAFGLLQKLFPNSKAKLVKLADIQWEQTFDDEERRKWHDFKMESKMERAEIQMKRMNLSGGTVIHC
jgi:hypothetical protein